MSPVISLWKKEYFQRMHLFCKRMKYLWFYLIWNGNEFSKVTCYKTSKVVCINRLRQFDATSKKLTKKKIFLKVSSTFIIVWIPLNCDTFRELCLRRAKIYIKKSVYLQKTHNNNHFDRKKPSEKTTAARLMTCIDWMIFSHNQKSIGRKEKKWKNRNQNCDFIKKCGQRESTTTKFVTLIWSWLDFSYRQNSSK